MMINGTVQGFPTFSTKGWIAVIFLGTFAGAIQFGLFTWALKWISPTTAGLYITLSPIAAVVLAILLIGESVTLVLVVGLALVLLAILLGSGALSQLWGLIRLPRDK